MPHDALTQPPQWYLSEAARRRASDSQQQQPQGTPCTVMAIVGNFVTVSIDATSVYTIPQITVPKSHSEWIREPTQVGDKGYLTQANYYLGGVSEQGGGTSSFYPRGNMTTLAYQPISQKTFATNPNADPNAAFVSGKNGVILTDATGVVNLTLAPNTPLVVNECIQIVIQGGAQPKIQVLGKTQSDLLYLGWGKTSEGDWEQVLTVAGPAPNVYARIS